MKTFHRLMYENLTPKEYKELCRVPVQLFNINLSRDFSKATPKHVLNAAFYWDDSPQKYDYWNVVRDRLTRSERQ